MRLLGSTVDMEESVSDSPASHTDPPERPPTTRAAFRTKFLYGFGSIAEGVKDTAFHTFLLFYFNQVLGLPGALSGGAIFLALCVDAITDPLVGSLSDNLHHRFGRRHPFMYAAALPMGINFWLLFNPPDGLGEYGLFAWFTVFAILVRSSMTLYSIPSNSMVAELTDDYDERTTLVSWRFMFGWAGGLTFTQIGYRAFFYAQEGMGDGRLNADAYGGFALVGGVAIVIAILVCSIGTHHLIPSLKPPPDKTPFTMQRFFREFAEVFGNRSYRMLVIGSLFASVAGGFNSVVGLYVTTYFWEFSAEQIASLALALAISLVLGVGLARPLSGAFEKRRIAVWLSAVGIFFGPLPIFLRLLGLMPANGHPALLPIILVHSVVLVTGVIIIGIVIASMIADTVDENELVTGKRQEGMFASAIAFSAKATSGIGGFLAGVALDLIAFPTQAEPGTIPAEKVDALGIAVGPMLLVLYLLSLVFLSQYRLTRAQHTEILDELARRHDSA
jgi:Na+/melibiose symporter-like transporter